PGSLGRLEELAAWAAAWQGRHPAAVERPLALVFAGEHGVAAARGVSAYPPAVTRQMVANFEAGGAAINQLCRAVGARLRVVPLLAAGPTADMTLAPAMGEAECAEAFEAGFGALAPGTDLLAVGEMGIGNTTAAAALCAALFGGPAAAWVGPGTGLAAAGVARTAAVVEAALARHAGALGEPLEALRRLGGRELAAIAGAVLAARLARVPVLLDGYVACAAAAVLHALEPSALDHCRAAHLSAEPGHAPLLERLGLDPPLLRLGMRLGEGSGAALAIPLVRAALTCHAGMATFEEAGVAGARRGPRP
ncbi:MAG TPA: nicotinate-nucleotide--dimethylbenzimidazole phosphoribosyltransferase, partial [Geminicoccaceae bacterium]|nr:nicotinate-nucleotide--dimethylbenzimidazole phosphoribosyltransferase [Geminicoccaceae bacterium]